MTRVVLLISAALFLCAFMKLNNRNDRSSMKVEINPLLPVIGIVIFDGVLVNEVVAPLDVFSKSDSAGNKLFNVVFVAREQRAYRTEEGLNILPNFIFADSPQLNVIVVPSSMSPESQTSDSILVKFIREKSKTAEYTTSHCAGAFLLGEAGVAKHKKIVTYCSGGDLLQKKYPSLMVVDDSVNAVVKDGNIISSNGNLVSYIASLDLLELMAGKTQRKYVENELLLNKLRENIK